MKLSILVPSIRTERLNDLYNSINDSCTFAINPWELIVISPFELPTYLQGMDNVRLIKSWRSPCAAQQQGLIEAKGEFIAWSSDDCTYLPKMIDESFKLLEGKDYKTIVVSKYLEGDTPNGMAADWYYTLRNHDSMKLSEVPEGAMLLNCGIVSRELLLELGGWDSSRFQVLPLAFNDFSIRAFKYGCKFILQEKPVCSCTHEPGMTGSHGPIHIAQTTQDQPVFTGLYSVPHERIKIPLNNWESTPEKWETRFGL